MIGCSWYEGRPSFSGSCRTYIKLFLSSLKRTAQAKQSTDLAHILNSRTFYTTSEEYKTLVGTNRTPTTSSLPLDNILPAPNLQPRSRRLRIHRTKLLAIKHQTRLLHRNPPIRISLLRLGRTLLSHLLNLRLIITPLIFNNITKQRPVQNPEDEEDPEHIHHLQHGQEAEGDGLRNPALVLLGLPVEDVGADGGKFAVGEEGVEDFEVEEVAGVGPDADEGDEVGDCEARVEVV